VVIRRPIEAVVTTVPLFAILFLPIGLGVHHIYLWAAPPASWSPRVAEQVHAKQAYLNVPHWSARALVFFALWSAAAWLLRRWSLSAEPDSVGRRRALSGAMAPVLALTLTFGAFDWMMSLDPTWTSNAYGFYVAAAGFLAASSLIALLVYAAKRAGVLP